MSALLRADRWRPSDPMQKTTATSHETHDPKAVERWKENQDWEKEFTPFAYYKFLREEIGREDELTNQRITWSMQFQGFLVAAMALLVSSSNWTQNMRPDIAHLRMLALPAIGFMGLSVALVTRGGVNASREAIENVKSYWECHVDKELNIIPSRAPRTYGDWRQHRTGASYVWWIPMTFFFFWLFYLLVLTFVVFAPKFGLEPFSKLI